MTLVACAIPCRRVEITQAEPCSSKLQAAPSCSRTMLEITLQTWQRWLGPPVCAVCALCVVLGSLQTIETVRCFLEWVATGKICKCPAVPCSWLHITHNPDCFQILMIAWFLYDSHDQDKTSNKICNCSRSYISKFPIVIRSWTGKTEFGRDEMFPKSKLDYLQDL